MKKFKFIILGAGPSGLSFAHGLLNMGYLKSDILLLESQSSPGGLCRSEIVDGHPIDVGGGHFLDIRKDNVINFLFKFMPREEWNLFNRISKITIDSHQIDYPIEANIHQFPIMLQAKYLESIAKAGSVSGLKMPKEFQSWIKWKLGEKIAEDYMLPYNKKIWSTNLDSLGTYWLDKLPNVSLEESILSCLKREPLGIIPAHQKFLYPKHHGYGEVWKRMGDSLGKSLVLECPIESIDVNTLLINNKYKSDIIINTIPWTIWPKISNIPKIIIKEIEKLEKTEINIEYHPTTIENNAHWIYEPNEKIPHHRKLLRSNFIKGANGYWTETNAKRFTSSNLISFHNEFAYPISTIKKPLAIRHILDWAATKRIIGIGRWGIWEHMNSDVAVDQALTLATRFKD